MRKLINNLFLLGGLLLTLAALPVFAQNEVEINKRPLQDFANSVNDKTQKKELDLNAPFSVELNAVLTANGRFDLKKSTYAKSTGDEQMIEVVKSSFEAIGDSGMLTYLKNIGVENLIIKANQDDKTLTVQLISELPTISRAQSVKSGITLMLSLAKQKIEGDTDEKTLLNAASTTNDGKKFILNFSIPKEVYQEMLLRKLKAVEANKAQENN